MTSLARRCAGTFRRCSRTQKPRQELRGKSSRGLRWAQLACACSLELCRCYAEIAGQLEPPRETAPSGARLRLRGGRPQIAKAAGTATPLRGL
eukprot:8818922-Pyramimonas_sp.AAC.1